MMQPASCFNHAAHAQAGDKAQAGSDQKLSGKSSDDDDAAARSKGAKPGSAHAGGVGGALANGAAAANGGGPDGAGDSAGDGAFDRSKFDKLAKRPPAGPAARKGAGRKGAPGKDKPAKGEGKGKPGKVRPPSPCKCVSTGKDTSVESNIAARPPALAHLPRTTGEKDKH